MSARDVLIVCGAGYVSGKEVVSLTLARGLRDLGYDVEFVASSWNDGDFVRRLDQAGFRYRCLRVGFISAALRWQPLKCTIDQMRYWPTLLIGYRRLVQARTPHAVIHTNWQHSLLLLMLMMLLLWGHHNRLHWVPVWQWSLLFLLLLLLLLLYEDM